MNFCKSVLATLSVAALALAGCGSDLNKGSAAGKGEVGGIAARLTLPDGTTIDTVNFHISGPGYDRTGNVAVGDSTVLTFRVGGIPVANGYTIELDAVTSDSESCLGSAAFDILNNQTTSITLTLSCGTTDDDNVGDLIVNGTLEQACPVVSAITALPAEVTVGNSVDLTAMISHGTKPVVWSGTGGTFGDDHAYATTFTCSTASATPYTLTVMIDDPSCSNASTVDVTCTLGAGCGNGTLDIGEECDDNNSVNDDACTNGCKLPACGDSIVQAGELCDDGGTVGGDGCSATCQTEVCGNNVTDVGEACDDGNTTDGDGCSATCALEGCGDGTVQGTETCDDGNAVTETCAYGDMSCTVCDSSCQSVSGATAYCGDSITNGPEACDDGPTGSATCSDTCTALVADNCATCREANCHTFFSGAMDAVAGCFDGGTAGVDARAAWTATVFTPAQIALCVDAMACAHAQHCGIDSGRPAAECYCGPAYPNNGDCGNGAAGTQDGVCKTEFELASEATAPSQVMLNIGSVDVPAGWAYNLLQCEGTFCPTECQ